jgi:hypothetical protein
MLSLLPSVKAGKANDAMEIRLTPFPQQLLEIWNKAKGKERDAMLWGDEVMFLASQHRSLACV